MCRLYNVKYFFFKSPIPTSWNERINGTSKNGKYQYVSTRNIIVSSIACYSASSDSSDDGSRIYFVTRIRCIINHACLLMCKTLTSAQRNLIQKQCNNQKQYSFARLYSDSSRSDKFDIWSFSSTIQSSSTLSLNRQFFSFCFICYSTAHSISTVISKPCVYY